MKLISRWLAVMMMLVASSGTLLLAHPGHGVLDSSAGHIFSSPYHLLCLGLAGAVCLAAARFTASPARQKILVRAGFCLIAGGIVLHLA